MLTLPRAGGLPPTWGNPTAWPSLVELTMQNNQLAGPLPQTWAHSAAFSLLETLDLEGKCLTLCNLLKELKIGRRLED